MSSSPNGLAHIVYFTLKDRSPQSRDGLVAACHRYLTDHPGTIHFSAGPRAEKYQRPVNDQAYDVALVLVFASEADHDRYQAAPRHKEFVAEQSGNWAQVRVSTRTCRISRPSGGNSLDQAWSGCFWRD